MVCRDQVQQGNYGIKQDKDSHFLNPSDNILDIMLHSSQSQGFFFSSENQGQDAESYKNWLNINCCLFGTCTQEWTLGSTASLHKQRRKNNTWGNRCHHTSYFTALPYVKMYLNIPFQVSSHVNMHKNKMQQKTFLKSTQSRQHGQQKVQYKPHVIDQKKQERQIDVKKKTEK